MENLTDGLHYHTWLEGDARKAVVDVQALAEALPHGSGIDGDWTITVRRNGDIGLIGEYHGMNEHGYYDGWSDIRASLVKVRKDVIYPLETAGFAQIINRAGDIVLNVRNRGDHGDYLHEVLAEALKSFVSRTGGNCIHVETGAKAEFSRERGGWVAVPVSA